MKKYILAACLLLLGLGAMAQEGSQNIGFNLGFASPVLRERPNASTTDLSATNMYGLKAGFVYEATIIKGFGFQMGLNYTFGTSLGKWEQSSSSTLHQTKNSYFYHQLEIPVDWQYKFEIAKETYLMLYTGPTIQCGIKFDQTNYDKNFNPATGAIDTKVTENNFYKISYDYDDLRDYNRLNITWGIGAGFQYQRYYLRGGYDFGIYNPYRDRYYTPKNDDSTGWNRKGRFDQWSIKLGIFLWQQ